MQWNSREQLLTREKQSGQRILHFSVTVQGSGTVMHQEQRAHECSEQRSIQMREGTVWRKKSTGLDFGEKDTCRSLLGKPLIQSQPIKSYGSQKWIHLNIPATLTHWGKGAYRRCGLGTNTQLVSKSISWVPHLNTLPV